LIFAIFPYSILSSSISAFSKISTVVILAADKYPDIPIGKREVRNQRSMQ
jgi:hypothetical protein